MAAGLLLLGLIVAWAVIIRVKTANGVIVVENVPEHAVLEVDGEKITDTPTVAASSPSQDEIGAGKYGVVVRRGDVVLLAESVTVAAGEQVESQCAD